MSFESLSYGKWILAGEHTVLRGGAALVFPVKDCFLKLTYENSKAPMGVEFSGTHGKELNLLFWGVAEYALKKVGKTRSDLVGETKIQNEIPIGTGLGASAALCVAVGRLWIHFGWIQEGELYEFCRSLEDLFHGESSGVDIAVSMSDAGLKFLRSGQRDHVTMKWHPQLYLSFSGCRGVTSECVSKVKALIESDPELGAQLDAQMKSSVNKAATALALESEKGFPLLADAIDEAASVFYNWGLSDGDIGRHMEKLKEAGANAVKPTGSGGGGYVLSLWQKEPPEFLRKDLIKV